MKLDDHIFFLHPNNLKQLIASDLVDLCLEVVYYFWWELVTEDFEQVDFLVSWDAFVRSNFDAFLHLKIEQPFFLRSSDTILNSK